MTEGLRIIIAGHVQGVGFRYATRAEALRLGLCGWVRNRTDGRVEAWFEGHRGALEQMLAWCQEGPRWASVTEVKYDWENVEAHHDTFEIRG